MTTSTTPRHRTHPVTSAYAEDREERLALAGSEGGTRQAHRLVGPTTDSLIAEAASRLPSRKSARSHVNAEGTPFAGWSTPGVAL